MILYKKIYSKRRCYWIPRPVGAILCLTPTLVSAVLVEDELTQQWWKWTYVSI